MAARAGFERRSYIHSIILRTAGKCDLPPNYGESRDWEKEVLSYH
jgi:hypothetical protein